MTLAYCAGYTVFIGLFLLHSHFKSQYKNIEIVAKNEAAPPEYCNEHLIRFFFYKNYMQLQPVSLGQLRAGLEPVLHVRLEG